MKPYAESVLARPLPARPRDDWAGLATPASFVRLNSAFLNKGKWKLGFEPSGCVNDPEFSTTSEESSAGTASEIARLPNDERNKQLNLELNKFQLEEMLRK